MIRVMGETTSESTLDHIMYNGVELYIPSCTIERLEVRREYAGKEDDTEAVDFMVAAPRFLWGHDFCKEEKHTSSDDCTCTFDHLAPFYIIHTTTKRTFFVHPDESEVMAQMIGSKRQKQ